MHPQMVALLSVAEGTSVITENLYDARFRYVGELARMGADITIDWQHAVVRGVVRCRGTRWWRPTSGPAPLWPWPRSVPKARRYLRHRPHRPGYEGFVERLSGRGPP